jgi:hypothetical protein
MKEREERHNISVETDAFSALRACEGAAHSVLASRIEESDAEMA